MTFFLCSLVLVLGVLLVAQGSALRLGTRYQSPQLHEGVWELDTRHRNTTVHRAVYMHGVAPSTEPGHRHRPHLCTITDELVHVDQCYCGATRYGVFGKWS